ncbi:MAG: hypothetical protein WCT44_02710 [Candidatus Paceibacterota bacterium]
MHTKLLDALIKEGKKVTVIKEEGSTITGNLTRSLERGTYFVAAGKRGDFVRFWHEDMESDEHGVLVSVRLQRDMGSAPVRQPSSTVSVSASATAPSPEERKVPSPVATVRPHGDMPQLGEHVGE